MSEAEKLQKIAQIMLEKEKKEKEAEKKYKKQNRR